MSKVAHFRHRQVSSDRGRVTVVPTDGRPAEDFIATTTELRRFAWALLADLDPVGVAEAREPTPPPAPQPRGRPRSSPVKIVAPAAEITGSWPRKPLSEADLTRIGAANWPKLGQGNVIAIAEAWNAGVGSKRLAADLGRGRGSVTLTLGKLTQLGVSVRRADA